MPDKEGPPIFMTSLSHEYNLAYEAVLWLLSYFPPTLTPETSKFNLKQYTASSRQYKVPDLQPEVAPISRDCFLCAWGRGGVFG